MNSESLPPGNNLPAADPAGAVAAGESEPAPGASPAAGAFPLHIPPILLEGDDVGTEFLNEDAQKFSLGLTAPPEPLESEGELPEAYGTQKLLLTARDPNWLCAHWDLTRDQQHQHCERSADGHLTLRVHREDLVEHPVAEIHVPPTARNWFVHVARAGTHYHAELGCQTSGGEWIPIATSAPTFTPPNRMSENTSVEFATIPFETPLPDLLELAGGAAAQNLSLTEALEKLRSQGHPDLPPSPATMTWTAAQERALAEVFNVKEAGPVSMGSFALADLAQRPPHELPASPTSPGGISSPFGGGPPEKKFWFNINAELVIYGATEPDVTVTIGGRLIPLRADGSFSYHFALPDGHYELPVVAVSADQTDGRAAGLQFTRATETRGQVGAHPQNPELKPPAPEHL